jgi:hypothetical protein
MHFLAAFLYNRVYQPFGVAAGAVSLFSALVGVSSFYKKNQKAA